MSLPTSWWCGTLDERWVYLEEWPIVVGMRPDTGEHSYFGGGREIVDGSFVLCACFKQYLTQTGSNTPNRHTRSPYRTLSHSLVRFRYLLLLAVPHRRMLSFEHSVLLPLDKVRIQRGKWWRPKWWQPFRGERSKLRERLVASVAEKWGWYPFWKQMWSFPLFCLDDSGPVGSWFQREQWCFCPEIFYDQASVEVENISNRNNLKLDVKVMPQYLSLAVSTAAFESPSCPFSENFKLFCRLIGEKSFAIDLSIYPNPYNLRAQQWYCLLYTEEARSP